MAVLHCAILVLLCVFDTATVVADFDYGGVPLWINRLVGEPSVLSMHDRMDSSWFRANNPQACPQQCDCPIQWPTALYCDHRGLADMPDHLPVTTQYLFLQVRTTLTRALSMCYIYNGLLLNHYGFSIPVHTQLLSTTALCVKCKKTKSIKHGILLFPEQQHLVPVFFFVGQHHGAPLAHPGPQPAAKWQTGPGHSEKPDPAVLFVCQPQPPEFSAQQSASWTQTAATGLQPNQQHQPWSSPELT